MSDKIINANPPSARDEVQKNTTAGGKALTNTMYKYDPASPKAEEFINHEEILETLKFAEENKHNKELIDEVIKKAEEYKGISHREAALLL